MSGLATSPLPSRASRTRGRKQRWPECARIGYNTRAVWGVPNKPTKSQVAHM